MVPPNGFGPSQAMRPLETGCTVLRLLSGLEPIRKRIELLEIKEKAARQGGNTSPGSMKRPRNRPIASNKEPVAEK